MGLTQLNPGADRELRRERLATALKLLPPRLDAKCGVTGIKRQEIEMFGEPDLGDPTVQGGLAHLAHRGPTVAGEVGVDVVITGNQGLTGGLRQGPAPFVERRVRGRWGRN